MSDPTANDRLNTTTLTNTAGSTPGGARQTQQSPESSQSRQSRQVPPVRTSSGDAPVAGAGAASSTQPTVTQRGDAISRQGFAESRESAQSQGNAQSSSRQADQHTVPFAQRGYANASGHVDTSSDAGQSDHGRSGSPRVTMASTQGDYAQTEFDRTQTSGTQYTRPAQQQPLPNQQAQGYDSRQQPGQGAWNQPTGMNVQGQFAGQKLSTAKPARTWQGIKLSVIGALSALALLCGLVGGLAGGLIAGAVSGGQSQMSGQGGMSQMGGGGYGQLNGQSGSGNSGSGTSGSGNSGSDSGSSDSGTSSNDSSSSAQSDINGTV